LELYITFFIYARGVQEYLQFSICFPSMSLTFDEYGRPFLILREQEKKSRLTGLQAQKVSLLNDSIHNGPFIYLCCLSSRTFWQLKR
jgi:hypothetical protein